MCASFADWTISLWVMVPFFMIILCVFGLAITGAKIQAAQFAKRVQEYECDMEPHMAVLRRMRLEYQGGSLWTAIQNSSSPDSASPTSAAPTSDLMHEAYKENQPLLQHQHLGTSQAVLPARSEGYQQQQSLQHPLQQQQRPEELKVSPDQGDSLEQQRDSLEQQGDSLQTPKQASAVMRAEIQLACSCLKSFWEQFLEDIDEHRLHQDFGRAVHDGKVDLTDSRKSSAADKMLWLLRSKEFRLLSEPCEIALWYSGGGRRNMQSNGVTAEPYTACRPQIYTRLETISNTWTDANCIASDCNDLLMAADNLTAAPRPVYQNSMVWAYATDSSCTRPPSMIKVDLGDPAQLEPTMQCMLLLI